MLSRLPAAPSHLLSFLTALSSFLALLAPICEVARKTRCFPTGSRHTPRTRPFLASPIDGMVGGDRSKCQPPQPASGSCCSALGPKRGVSQVRGERHGYRREKHQEVLVAALLLLPDFACAQDSRWTSTKWCAMLSSCAGIMIKFLLKSAAAISSMVYAKA